MSEPGFMIALNVNDFLFPFDGPYASGYESNTRNICSVNSQNTYTKAPWWTCENIQLTAGGVATPSATVGTTYIVKVGFQGLPSISQEDPLFSSIETVQAWVCYPNTVAGRASPTLVVPSMQNNAFASFSNTSKPGTSVFGSLQPGDYQSAPSYAVVSLSSWTPTQEDFLEESVLGGHTCIIANSSGQASLLDDSDPNSGEAVGVQITDNSQLSNVINVCNNIYQAQRNIVILPAGQIRGGVIRPGFAFLSGEPDRTNSISTTVSVTAIDQGNEVDPVPPQNSVQRRLC